DGKSFTTYNSKTNGLISNIWNCGINDDKGKLWLGSPRGINTFTPPLKTNTIPPPVHITFVKVMDKEIPISPGRRFEHDQSYFKFGFTGICLTAPESITYKWRLKGMEKDWQDIDERSVFYPYLPPKKYTFQVKACNNDGVESLKHAEFSFEILPPFWATWWFYIFAFLVVLSLMFVSFRLHFKRVQEKRTMAEEKRLLKARTNQLVMSQRMELMGMLAAGAVHDMKNLMTVIIGYSDIITRDAHIDDKNNQLLAYIRETAGTAANMVKQILKFSRQKENAPQTVSNMALMLADTLELLKVTIPKETQLKWHPPTKDILSPITPVHLQQIVMNLCINAVHAMPDGGTLEVTLNTPDTPDENKEVILLEVSDNGCGMEKEIIGRIFDPLFTTKEDGKGTGLGLFVTKQIVEQYNGSIDVQSQPGKGTRFSIRFRG
ncbi:MAG: hypothetical protein GY765_16330, partial [bacterium]|nr:hypothetical protein [bacterium]